MEWKHEGRTILVTRQGRFCVDEEVGVNFTTLEEARQAVNEFVRKHPIQLGYPVLLPSGELARLKGVHRNTGGVSAA